MRGAVGKVQQWSTRGRTGSTLPASFAARPAQFRRRPIVQAIALAEQFHVRPTHVQLASRYSPRRVCRRGGRDGSRCADRCSYERSSISGRRSVRPVASITRPIFIVKRLVCCRMKWLTGARYEQHNGIWTPMSRPARSWTSCSKGRLLERALIPLQDAHEIKVESRAVLTLRESNPLGRRCGRVPASP